MDDPTITTGVKEFLHTLSDDDIYGLLKTTTGGLITASSTNGAIAEIIKFSDAISILNRRRVKKEFLIKYLGNKKVPFSIKSDKSKLCRAILDHWKLGEDKVAGLRFADSPTQKHTPHPRATEGKSAVFTNAKPAIASLQSLKPKILQSEITRFCKPTVVSTGSTPTTRPLIAVQEPKPPTTSSANNQIVAQTSAASNALLVIDDEEEPMDYEECVILRKKELQVGQELGEQFSKWYYDRLNMMTEFSPEHFWPECNLRLEYIRNYALENRQIREVLHNGPKCYEEICSLRINKGLYFNPNLLSGIGVRGKINPHGLAQVIVCGTLHTPSETVGVFEQVFGLMKDPQASNNFKIKFSVLRLREGNHMINGKDVPQQCDASLVGLLEEEDEIDDEDAETD